ncbi:hypothetical protein Tco_1519167, partial [Tanacetum coccineum]
MNLLEKHLTNEILHEIDCKTTLTKLKTMFQNTFNSKLRECLQNYTALETYSVKDTIIGDMDFVEKYMIETILHQKETQKLLTEKKLLQMTNKYFANYTGIKVKQFRETLLQHMSNVKKFVAEITRHKRLSKTESEVQDINSRPENDTDTDDADIRPVYDKE